jgi:hypothetical protein
MRGPGNCLSFELEPVEQKLKKHRDNAAGLPAWIYHLISLPTSFLHHHLPSNYVCLIAAEHERTTRNGRLPAVGTFLIDIRKVDKARNRQPPVKIQSFPSRIEEQI